jgi:hypothetical protein
VIKQRRVGWENLGKKRNAYGGLVGIPE